MIVIRVFQTYIETLEIEKNILGNLIIKEMKKIEIIENDRWQDQLKKLVEGKELSVVFSNNKIYYHRFKIPTDTADDVFHSLVLNKAKEIIPEKLSEIVSDYSKLSDGNVFFVALPFIQAKNVIDWVSTANVKFGFATSEPLALFQVVRSVIKPDEVIGYLDIEEEQSILTFYDSQGPLFSFTEPIDTIKLKVELLRSLKNFEEKYVQQISTIIIGGGKSLDIDLDSFDEIFSDRILVHIDKIIEDILKKEHIDFKVGLSSRIIPPVFIGVSLLFYLEDRINLFNKKNLDYIQNSKIGVLETQSEKVQSFLEKKPVPTILLQESSLAERFKKNYSINVKNTFTDFSSSYSCSYWSCLFKKSREN